MPTGQTQYNVTGGTRAGTNLFHSFGEFNVPTNNIANFLNDTGLSTSNILGRVNGGNPSSIYGTIQTTDFGNANLYLINPAGIVFGPSATLNVGGSVAFTTADYLRLAEADGTNAGIFHANPAAESLLTSAPVAAFGFLGSNAAAISVQGSTLAVQPGQSISLVSGSQGFTHTNPDTGDTASVPDSVTISGGNLSAPSGEIRVASVASPGEILYSNLGMAPNIDGASFNSLGTIMVSDASSLDTSGTPGGTVRIRGGKFVVDGSFLSSNTSGDIAGTSVAIQVDVQGTSTFRNASSIVSFSEGAGRAGDIEIHTGMLDLADGSAIFSGSLGSAAPGSIRVTASESVSLRGTDPFGFGSGSNITSDSSDFCGCTDPAGEVKITTPLLTLDDRATIETRAFGDRPGGSIALDLQNLIVKGGSAVQAFGGELAPGGNITITASDTILLSGQFDIDTLSRIANINEGVAGTGSILIETGDIRLEQGARIRNESLSSLEPNQDPKITIHAVDTVSLSGGSNIRVLNVASDVGEIEISGHTIALADQSVIRTETFGDGNAGPINITGHDLQITGGSLVESSTFFNAGAGGNITINLSGSLSLSGTAIGESGEIIPSNISSRTTGNGTGGQIVINALDHVILTDGAVITASSTGPADAGNIAINAGRQLDMHDSSIKTEAAQAAGGNIDIRAVDRVSLVNSTISTSVLGGSGSGGNITIDPTLISLANSSILAQAVLGNGGNIRLVAGLLLVDPTSVISASSEFGQSGTIQSPTSNLAGTVGSLPSSVRQGQALQAQRCAVLNTGESSSFIIAGRDTVPTEPGGWMVSSIASLDAGVGLEARGKGDGSLSGLSSLSSLSGSVRTGIPSHQIDQTDQIDEPPILSLRRMTPAGFLTQHFAEGETSGCRS